jgi:hypothetical protein
MIPTFFMVTLPGLSHPVNFARLHPLPASGKCGRVGRELFYHNAEA